MGGLRRRKFLYAQENTKKNTESSSAPQSENTAQSEIQKAVIPEEKKEIQENNTAIPVKIETYNVSRQKLRHEDKTQPVVQTDNTNPEKQNTNETIESTAPVISSEKPVTEGIAETGITPNPSDGNDTRSPATENTGLAAPKEGKGTAIEFNEVRTEQSTEGQNREGEESNEKNIGDPLSAVINESECGTNKNTAQGNEEKPSVIPQDNTVLIEVSQPDIPPVNTEKEVIQSIEVVVPMDHTTENLVLLQGKTKAVSVRLPGNLYDNLHEEYMYNCDTAKEDNTFVKVVTMRLLKAKKFIKPTDESKQ